MIAKTKKGDAPSDFSNHVLFALELQIARRADQLAKTAPLIRNQNLKIWLQAERDVLSRLSTSPASAGTIRLRWRQIAGAGRFTPCKRDSSGAHPRRNAGYSRRFPRFGNRPSACSPCAES